MGQAEADEIRVVGEAEAHRMSAKASAYKEYGDAAVMSMVLESLPKIAAEVAAPLSRTDEIVVLTGQNGTAGNITSEVSKLVAGLPPAVNALTGETFRGYSKRFPVLN